MRQILTRRERTVPVERPNGKTMSMAIEVTKLSKPITIFEKGRYLMKKPKQKRNNFINTAFPAYTYPECMWGIFYV